MIVSVVASGPSALECGAARAPGYVIACNDMFRHAKCDAVISMDGLWTRARIPDYFDALDSRSIHLRRSAFKYFEDGPSQYPFVNIFDCDNKSDVMSPDARVLNGRHTGQCALNLAFTMKPRTVFLYGFDLRGKDTGHCHRDYEWKGQGNTNNATKFREWADGFGVSAQYFNAAGIAVYNTNPKSAIRAFKHGRPPA